MPHNSNIISTNSFRLFLDNDHVEMHSIAERMFRHSVMSHRRNCPSFGNYIKDLCARIILGDEDDLSMFPCKYKIQKANAASETVT